MLRRLRQRWFETGPRSPTRSMTSAERQREIAARVPTYNVAQQYAGTDE